MAISKYITKYNPITENLFKHLNSSYTKIQNIEGEEEGVIFSVSDRTHPQSRILNKPLNYTNFTIPFHYEADEEIQLLFNKDDLLGKEISDVRSDDFYKVDFNYIFNYYSEEYEKQIQNFSELNIINFYKTLDFLVFKRDPKEILGNNPRLDYRYFDDKIYKKTSLNHKNNLNIVTYDKDMSKFFKKNNTYKSEFPFYTQIIFNNEKKEKYYFTDLLNKYNLYNELLFDLARDLKPTNIIGFREWSIAKKNVISNFYSYVDELNDIVEKNKSTFKDLLNSKKTYREIIAYKLVKYDIITGTNPTPLQTWYIPNTKDSIIEFIDNQVKYQKNYRYTLSYIVMSINLDLYWKSVFTTYSKTNNTHSSRIEYKLDNILQISEITGPTYVNMILDTPPLPPDVEFIPFHGEDKRIKMFFNTSIGKYEQFLHTFNSKEVEEKDKILRAQKKKKTVGKVLFSNDDISKFFEIYRLDHEPILISEFFDKGRKTIINTKNSSAAAFIDDVVPNRKYYYVFRALDHHLHFSNPSFIYTAEIVNENGTIFPIFGTYDINSRKFKFKESSRNFKQGFVIQPSVMHMTVPEDIELNVSDMSGIVKNVPIGQISPGVWEKKFKLRVTSLSTGKKIDINMIFNVKREEKFS